MRLQKLVFLLILIWGVNSSIFAVSGGIELNKRVNDYANTLTKLEEFLISDKLNRLEDSTKIQLVVVIIVSTKPQSIEYYTQNLANKTGIGRKGYDDGLLMLIAKDDRKVRIEVGKGLTNVISDNIAQEIIDNFIIPYFKNGDFNTGINEGVDALTGHLVVGELPTPPHARFYWTLWLFIPLIILVEVIKRFTKYRGLLLFISVVLAFLLGWFAVNLIIGLALTCAFYLVSFMMLRFPKYRLSFKRGSESNNFSYNTIFSIGIIGTQIVREDLGNYSSSGSFGSSSSGGFGGSGGDGSSGFSGGGGSFGGGGATGGW